MPSYEYRVQVSVPQPGSVKLCGVWHECDANTWTELPRVVDGREIPWTHESAYMACHKVLGVEDGAELRIQRRRELPPTSTRGHEEGWKLHRAYRVDEDGRVRRTDR